VQLDAQFESNYRGYIEGAHHDVVSLDVLAARILSRDMRLSIISNIETETSAELQRLDKRNAELSKILGRPRHNLNK